MKLEFANPYHIELATNPRQVVSELAIALGLTASFRMGKTIINAQGDTRVLIGW